MKVTVAIDSKALSKKFDRLEELKKNTMPQAYSYFKKITPIRSGNARRNTSLTTDYDIEANYPYAQRLDQGWSRQASGGMSEPTVKKILQLVRNYLRKIGA